MLLCPECRDGKLTNCVGVALDPETDDFVECGSQSTMSTTLRIPNMTVALKIQHPDDPSANYLSLHMDGHVTGTLVDKYPESEPAFKELCETVVNIMKTNPF